MFTDCSLLRSNFLPVKVSAVNSTGPSNVQLIQVSVYIYTGPLLQKKIKGENVYFCLDTLEKLSMQCRVYFMQVFLDISSVCMNVAELYFLLFQVSQWLS